MPFSFSCFLSYRRDQTIVQRFVKDLSQGLSYELAPMLDLDVFVDTNVSGEGQDETIAQAICRSVCMIPVFTPTYFSEASPSCAREFQAMIRVEETRNAYLGDRTHGVIIPVVLRGVDQMPEEMRTRQFFSFDRYLLGDEKIYRSPGFQESVLSIAKYVYDRHRQFQEHEYDPSGQCADFRLPSESEIRPWLKSVASRAPRLPFRGA